MQIRILTLTLMAFMLVGSAYGQTIDRANLNGYVDLYFSALVAHDPDRLPLTPWQRGRQTSSGGH